MRQFTSGLAHFKACVHDSASISRPIFKNQIWYVDLCCKEQEQVLSVTQSKVISARAHNLTSGCLY